jgi:hypothetical protein
LRKALSYVAQRSKSSHINTVKWTETSAGDGHRRLQVEIETTDSEGCADYRWQLQIFKYPGVKTFDVDEYRVDIAKLY